MKATLKGANVVIIASSFNPSIVSKDWLINKGVVKELPKNFTHTPGFSFFESENFKITLLPDRFQLELKKIDELNLKELAPIAERFVTSLPETPYTAVGTNYLWQAEAEAGEDIDKILKEIITFNWERSKSVFREEDTSLGGTVWLNHNGFLMRLSIVPDLERKKYILCDFNYHANIVGVEELKEMLSKSPEALTHSSEIVKELLARK